MLHENSRSPVIEILGSKCIGVISLTFLGSRDVISHMTIQFPIAHFLLVVLWNQASISNGFWDIQWWKWP